MRSVMTFFLVLAFFLCALVFSVWSSNVFWTGVSSLTVAVVVLGALYLYWLDRSEILSFDDTVMSRGAYRANMPATLSHTVMELAEKEMLCFHGDLASPFFNNEKIIVFE